MLQTSLHLISKTKLKCRCRDLEDFKMFWFRFGLSVLLENVAGLYIKYKQLEYLKALILF